MRCKGSGEDNLGPTLTGARPPQKMQIAGPLAQAPARTRAINNPASVLAGRAGLGPASRAQPAAPKQVWESHLWHIMKRVCMCGGRRPGVLYQGQYYF